MFYKSKCPNDFENTNKRENAKKQRADDIKEEYLKIRDSMYRELSQTGACRVIEDILATQGYCLYQVNYPAVLIVAMYDVFYALHGQAPLSQVWADAFIVGDRTYRFSDFGRQDFNEEHLQQINANCNKLINVYRDIQTKVRARRAAGDYGRENERLQPDMRSEADHNPRNDAQNTANIIRREAEKEAARIRAEAENQALNIRREAKAEAELVRTNAQREAQRLIDEAGEEADKILRNAHEEAAREAKADADRLVRQNLQDYLQEQRQLWEEEQAGNAANADDTARAVAMLKDDVNSLNTILGANFSQSIEQLQQRLEGLKAGMISDLQQWRTSLYKCEYGNLINFYTLLTSVAGRFEREALEVQTAEPTSERAREIIVQHSNSLNKLQGNLIRAMERMGLQLFEPQPGDRFDSFCHTVNDDEDDDVYLDQIIEACTRPGVERVINDKESSVLMRATVTISPTQDF